MAYLESGILLYHPSNVGEPDGYVYFPDGDTSQFNLRLWSKSVAANQRMRAEFHFETVVPREINTFFFGTPKAGGGINPLGRPSTIKGPKKETIKVEYATNATGDALIYMYATKTSSRWY
jgi:hypothetical protein